MSRLGHRRTRRSLTLAALAGWLVTAQACRPDVVLDHGGLRWPDGAGAVTVPARRVGDLQAVAVSANEATAEWWVVDTGCLGNAIVEAHAKKLALASADDDLGGQLSVRTGAAAGKLSACWIDALDVGGLRLGRHPAYVLGDDLFEIPGMREVKGVLGQEFLRLSIVTIDAGAPSVTFHRPATFTPPQDAVEIPVEFTDHIPYVQGRLPDGTEVRLLLDTGAGAALSLDSGFASHVSLLSERRRANSALGPTQDRAGRLASLTALGRTFTGIDVVVFEGADVGRSKPMDGLIGNRLLAGLEVTLDAAHARLWVRDSTASR